MSVVVVVVVVAAAAAAVLLITAVLRKQLERRGQLKKNPRCGGHAHSAAVHHHADHNMLWLQARKLCRSFSPSLHPPVLLHPSISSSDDGSAPIP